MSAISFPRILGQLSREQYLTLLLAALVNQCDGKLHINSQSLTALDLNVKLLVDWENDSQQLVLRVASPSLVVAEVKGAGWTTLSNQPLSPQPSPPDPTKHAIATDERIIEYIRKAQQRDLMRQWKDQTASAVADMPPPDPATS